MKTIPIESTFYQCISDVIKWHKQYPDDWKQTWFELQKHYSEEVGCPDGVFVPLDIDAKINAAYIVLVCCMVMEILLKQWKYLHVLGKILIVILLLPVVFRCDAGL